MLRGTDTLVIDDLTPIDHQALNIVGAKGATYGRGLIPRDYSEARPAGLRTAPGRMQLIPQSEWTERIKDKEAAQSALSHIKNFAALDQDGQGFCWAYSSTGAVMLVRAKNNQPYVRLSAHAIACKIKGFRDEGGWCGLSAEWQKEHGTPSVRFWPEKSMSREHDTQETWGNAALHKVTEDWVDLDASIYDRNLTDLQHGTCLLLNNPCPSDYNWWGHSVCAVDVVDGVSSFDAGLLRHPESFKLLSLKEFEIRWAVDDTAGFGRRILNSWTEEWGAQGMGVLAGTRARQNSAVCLLVTGGSAT